MSRKLHPGTGKVAAGRPRTRCGLTPSDMLERCDRMFRRRGFTVNEFIAREHWQRTSGRVEGARELLQALVQDGLVGRGSRCDVGYSTEVEYVVLEAGRLAAEALRA